MQPRTISQSGLALRPDDWESNCAISDLGRKNLDTIENWSMLNAALQARTSPFNRLLLAHLVLHLQKDQRENLATRFIVFPGNRRLSDTLHTTERTVQRAAAELERQGFLRRCYSDVNRRIGFDLTLLAMRHKEILEDTARLHLVAREERDQRQFELSIADQIAVQRPSYPSPRGDNSVTHNQRQEPGYREPADPTEANHRADVLPALSAIALDKIPIPLAIETVSDDRAEYLLKLGAIIAQRLTGAGIAANLGWTSATRKLGQENAIKLYLLANADPKRRNSTERYFNWLLRQASSPTGNSIVNQIAQRIGAAKINPGALPDPAGRSELPEMTKFRDRIEAEIGAELYTALFADSFLSKQGHNIEIAFSNPVLAQMAERSYGSTIRFIAQAEYNEGDIQLSWTHGR